MAARAPGKTCAKVRGAQLLIGREHEGHGAIDQAEPLQGPRREQVGHKPRLHVGHAGPGGPIALYLEGPRLRRTLGENRIHMPEEHDPRLRFAPVRLGHEDVAKIRLPRLVGGRFRLGHHERLETRLAQPIRQDGPQLVHILRVGREGIHVDDPLQQTEHVAFLRVEIRIKLVFP